MDIEEGPFETLDIVEVAMNNDNNELRKMVTPDKEIQHSIKIKLKTGLKAPSITELIEELEMEEEKNIIPKNLSKLKYKLKLNQIKSTANYDLETYYE